MTIAVDTNALLALIHDDDYADRAEEALRDAYREGGLVITSVVRAELAADGQFPSSEAVATFLDDLSIDVTPVSTEAAFRSGEAFATYSERRPDGLQCPACGTIQTVVCPECDRELTPRQHIAADFLIGGHAVTDAEALITFDKGFYESSFPGLDVRPGGESQ